MKNIAALSLLLCANFGYGQLGFCGGSKGNPIFFENFGSGTNFGPPLPAGTTTYTFVSGSPSNGEYTVHYRNSQKPTWHDAPDHTFDEAPDGINGKALIVNAGDTPGQFYRRVVGGLCVNTNFEFSAWIENVFNPNNGVCPGADIPVDVTFEIWDATETTLLKSGSTGPIPGTVAPIYTQYALTFTTLPGQTSVVLKMRNNGAGGCGNDLAIDDIAFCSCGDFAAITTPLAPGKRLDICATNLPLSVPMHLSVPNLTPHAFQWQQSPDTSVWTNIAGQNGLTYTPNISDTRFFRVIIAQDAANLANPFCYTISEIFSVIVTPQPNPPASNGDVFACSAGPIPPLTVSTASGVSADWLDAPVGGNVLQANSTAYAATVSGTYYAEATAGATECRSATRTPVRLDVSPTPPVFDEQIRLCPGEIKTVDAGVANAQYVWSTGETTQTIQVASAGNYSVTVTNADGCAAVKNVSVEQDLFPINIMIDINENNIEIRFSTPNLEYSLDNIHYTDWPAFYDLAGGIHTVYIRKKTGCAQDLITREAVILSVPDFFTPNNDGYNDRFEVPELALLPHAVMTIYDRYGKLLKQLTADDAVWDGTYNGHALPASDYWYRVTYDFDEMRTGHFTLKR